MPIQWTLDLALGIPELDGQHLQIDAHLHMLHDAICEDRPGDLGSIVDGLRKAAAEHFACEERFMRAHGHPKELLEPHAEAHRWFAERIAAIEAACRRDGPTTHLAIQFGHFLTGWVREHQRHDGELRAYARPTRHAGGG